MILLLLSACLWIFSVVATLALTFAFVHWLFLKLGIGDISNP